MSWFDRLSQRHRIAVSTVSQTGGNLAVALISVGVLNLITHQLGPSEYGLFALIVTYVSLFTFITDLGLTAMTNRELAREGSNQESILSVAMSSRITLALAIVPIIVGSAFLLYPGYPISFEIAMTVMAFDVLFRSIQAVSGTVFSVRLKGHVTASLLFINRVLYLFGVVVVTIVKGPYLAYVCVYVGADLAIAIIYLVLVRRVVPLRWSRNLRAWQQALVVAIPLGIIQVITNIYSWVDSIMVSVLRTSAELGFYSLAFNMVNVLAVVPGFLMIALMPQLVNADQARAEQLVNRAIYVLVCIGAPLAAGAVVLNAQIVHLVAGPNFGAAGALFAVLALTLPISFAQTALSYSCVTLNRYRPLVIVNLVVLAVNIVVNLVMIRQFGPIGAAITLLGTEVISLMGTTMVFSRLTQLRVRLLSVWTPFVAAGFAGGVGAVCAKVLPQSLPLLIVCVVGAMLAVVYVSILSLFRGFPEEIPLPAVLRRLVHRSH